MTIRMGRVFTTLLASIPLVAAATAEPETIRCRNGGEAAVADYRPAFEAETTAPRLGQEPAYGAYVGRLQRAVANDCTHARYSLLMVRMSQFSKIKPGAEPARKDALDAEMLSLATGAVQVDGEQYGLGLLRVTMGSRHYDLDAAMAAFETGAANGETACISFLIWAYSDEGLRGFANNPRKAAYWREKQQALEK